MCQYFLNSHCEGEPLSPKASGHRNYIYRLSSGRAIILGRFQMP